MGKFLGILAQIITKGLQIVGVFGSVTQKEFPQTGAIVNTVSQDLSEIANIVTSVEVAGQALQLKGPDKLKAAAPLVAQVILQSAMLAGHKIQNQDLFNQGVNEIASGVVDVINSLHADGTNKMVVENKKA